MFVLPKLLLLIVIKLKSKTLFCSFCSHRTATSAPCHQTDNNQYCFPAEDSVHRPIHSCGLESLGLTSDE